MASRLGRCTRVHSRNVSAVRERHTPDPSVRFQASKRIETHGINPAARRPPDRAMNRTPRPSVSVSEYLLHAVSGWGTRVAFGTPQLQGSVLLGALNAATFSDEYPRFFIAHDARAACFMADGYARVSGSVGVCATGAPCASQAAAGLMFAKQDGVPLVLLTAGCSERSGQAGASREGDPSCLDSLELLTKVSSHIARIERPQALLPFLTRAAATLGGPRAGVVVLSLSSDMASKPISPESPPAFERPHIRAEPSDWHDCAQRLLKASRPLLFLGTGARRALEDPRDQRTSSSRLRRLITALERHAVPVVTSPRAKGIFPETHPLSLGCYGMAGNEWSRRYVNRGLDALTVVGSRLGQWTTGGWDRRLAPSGPFVHVDVDPQVPGLTYANTLGLTADAGAFLDHLIEQALHSEPCPSAAERRSRLETRVRSGPRWLGDAERASLAIPLKPQRLMSELQAVLNHHVACKAGVNLFCEKGNGLGWVWHHLVLEPPHRLWSTIRGGTSGWASCAVIGGKLAQPERPAIAILGEPALLVGGDEISSAAEQRVGAVWLVLAMASRQTGWTRNAADLCSWARSFGARAREVSLPGQLVRELGVALEAARDGQPQVLVSNIDPLERPDFPHLVTRDWLHDSGPREAGSGTMTSWMGD